MSESAREIILGDNFGEVAVKASGLTEEIHADNSIDAYTSAPVRTHAPKDGITPGDRMEDGTICAGISPENHKLMYTMADDAPDDIKRGGNAYTGSLDALGHKDWRLPAMNELKVLFENRAKIQKTKHVRAALGLHPQLIAEHSAEIDLWEEYLPQARYVGEVGLDAGPRYFRSLELQRQIFTRILQKCAEAGGKILTVHSVRSATMVLDLIESHLPQEQGQIVLHWFTGSTSEARRAIDLGCYFSINSAMLSNDRGRKLVAALPSNRLLTETDAPFTKIGDRPSAPIDVNATIEALSILRGLTQEDLAQTIRSNLRSLLERAGVPEKH